MLPKAHHSRRALAPSPSKSRRLVETELEARRSCDLQIVGSLFQTSIPVHSVCHSKSLPDEKGRHDGWPKTWIADADALRHEPASVQDSIWLGTDPRWTTLAALTISWPHARWCRPALGLVAPGDRVVLRCVGLRLRASESVGRRSRVVWLPPFLLRWLLLRQKKMKPYRWVWTEAGKACCDLLQDPDVNRLVPSCG